MTFHAYITATRDEMNAIMRRVRDEAEELRGLGVHEDGVGIIAVTVLPHEWEVIIRHAVVLQLFVRNEDRWNWIDNTSRVNAAPFLANCKGSDNIVICRPY